MEFVWISIAHQVDLSLKVSNEAGESGRVICGVILRLRVAIRLEENKEWDIDAADDWR